MIQILLVEDDKIIAELYRMKLAMSKYRVTIAEHGLDALNIIQVLTPDIILLDLNMPVMDGAKFLEKIRKNSKWSDIPVIILTNISKDEAPKTIWHHGISGYYVKAHHTPAELVQIVEKVIRDQD